jgi:proline dehydrogenase
MTNLATSHSPLLNPDRNPLLRSFLKKTFYAQFCAGENAQEVEQTVKGLRDLGFKGVMLGYAKEVVLDEKAKQELAEAQACPADESCIQNEILPWKKGILETVAMTEPGDFVALK